MISSAMDTAASTTMEEPQCAYMLDVTRDDDSFSNMRASVLILCISRRSKARSSILLLMTKGGFQGLVAAVNDDDDDEYAGGVN